MAFALRHHQARYQSAAFHVDSLPYLVLLACQPCYFVLALVLPKSPVRKNMKSYLTGNQPIFVGRVSR